MSQKRKTCTRPSWTIIDYIMWGKLSRRNYVLDGPEGARERELATAMQRMATEVVSLVWDEDSRDQEWVPCGKAEGALQDPRAGRQT